MPYITQTFEHGLRIGNGKCSEEALSSLMLRYLGCGTSRTLAWLIRDARDKDIALSL
jgi:hypothetical protein